MARENVTINYASLPPQQWSDLVNAYKLTIFDATRNEEVMFMSMYDVDNIIWMMMRKAKMVEMGSWGIGLVTGIAIGYLMFSSKGRN